MPIASTRLKKIQLVLSPSAAADPTTCPSIKVLGRVGREYILALPPGEVAVEMQQLDHRLQAGADGVATWRFRHTGETREWFEFLCRLIEAGSSVYVPVTLVGKGSSDKSCRVRVERVVYPDRLRAGFDEKELEHTITVARSPLRVVAGQLYAPKWLIKRVVHERILVRREWPLDVRGGVYLDQEALWDSVFAPIDQLLTEQAELARAREEAERPRREEEARKAKALAEQREADYREQAERARISAARAAANRLKLPAIKASRVEWDGWVTRRSKYGGTQREKVTYEATDCTLRISGQRVYLQFDDGKEIIKALSSVRWEEDASEDATGTGSPEALSAE